MSNETSEFGNRKKPFSPSTKAITLNVRCGDCVFFKRDAIYKEPCDKLGVVDINRPCHLFTPNHYDLGLSYDGLKDLNKLISKSLPASRFPLLAALLNREIRTQRQGFKFGQLVYIRIYGDDYVNNYVNARVIQANPRYVYLRGKNNLHAMVMHDSVLTKEQWEAKKAKLTKAGLLEDPKTKWLDAGQELDRFPNMKNVRVTSKKKPGKSHRRPAKMEDVVNLRKVD